LNRVMNILRPFVAGRVPRLLTAALAVLPAARTVQAQNTAPVRLTLSYALDLAERQGYDSLLAEASVHAAEGDLTAARLLQNPLFSGVYVRSTGVLIGNSRSTASGYSLSLADQGAGEGILSGKRGLRVREAREALTSARSNREDALRLLRFGVAQEFYVVLAAEAALRVSRDVAKSFDRAYDLVGVRYRYGAVSEVDLDRVETAKLEAEQTATAAAAQVAQAKAGLALLLGVDPSAPLELEGSLDGETPAWLAGGKVETFLAEAPTHRPDVAAARAALAKAQAALDLARRGRLPDVSLLAAYAREGPEEAPVTPPSVSLGATFELPLLNQRQGEIARAESDRVSAKIALDRAEAKARADVLSAWAAFSSAREAVERMKGRLLERARRARDLVELQYRSGAISLLDLLDAERTALSVGLEFEQDLNALRASEAQVAAAVGRNLVP
jgi:cobalt-zinc-cadmium efflux system outer membrane protein